MTICDACLTNLNIPIESKDNHYFCFLCIINSSLYNPDAFSSIPDNNNELSELNGCTNYLWLYSSNYNGLWWCYDSNSNKKIECIYKDYLFRQELPNNEEQFIITCDFSKKQRAVKTLPTNYISKSFDELIDNIDSDTDTDTDTNIGVSFSDNNLIKQPVSISSSKSFDELIDDIDTDTDTNTDSDISVSFSDNNLIKQPVTKSQESQESQELSYILKFGSLDYKFDFDSMKQINMTDMWKKRALQRIEIPNDIIKTNLKLIVNYLRTQNIIGISGKKFDFLLE